MIYDIMIPVRYGCAEIVSARASAAKARALDAVPHEV